MTRSRNTADAPWAQALLDPNAVALIGASAEKGSVGRAIIDNLVSGRPKIPIHAVNPRSLSIAGADWSAGIEQLPEVCDLAVVAVPAAIVPETIARLGRHGTKCAIVISAGLARHSELCDAMLAHAAEYDLRLIGPNCLGALLPHARINASFAPCQSEPGHLALLSQSGALTTAILDWAAARRVGFSAVLSVGDMADIDLADLVALFGDDPHTRAILLYVEGLRRARAFIETARQMSQSKPIIAIKAGRSAAAGRAALSHTGALTGAYDVYRAGFRRAGVLLVESLDELFDAAAMLDDDIAVAGDRLAVITNGGGAGILAVDALQDAGGRLAMLPDSLVASLDRKLPAGWSRANPLDIVGDAHADRYRTALSAVLDSPDCDAALVMNCPTALAPPRDAAEAVIETVQAARGRGIAKPVFGCWLGDSNAAAVRSLFAAAGIPLFETPTDAVRGFSYLTRAHRIKDASPAGKAPTGPKNPARREAAETLFARVRADDRCLLSEIEAKQLLGIYGIPVTETMLAPTPDAVAEACGRFRPPFVVKIVSPDITHKSDFGGVALGLSDAGAARAAAEAMVSRIATRFPDARLDGFAVQPMIRRKHAHELFAGIATDPSFGPILMFGAGGTAIEVLADKAIALPPLQEDAARALIDETRISRLLAGYRDVPAADIDALVAILLALSDMVAALAELRELDVNPLLADAEGAIALDARVVIASPDAGEG